MRLLRLAALLVLWLAVGGLALAQGRTSLAGSNGPPSQAPAGPAAPTSVPWSSLSADQRHLLSRFSGSWDKLPAERQQALARGSNRWLHMTPKQRVTARQRFQRWQALPRSQRQQLRQRWEQFRSLPPDRQRSVRENFRRFESLPAQQRQQLRRRWLDATPTERQRMLEQARRRMLERRQMRREDFPARPRMGLPPQRGPFMQPAPFGGGRFHPYGGAPRGPRGRLR